MTKSSFRIAAGILLAAALSPFAALAQHGGGMPSAQIDLADKASLQRGAALYMNYCSGCHSLNYQRYSRTAEDLGLTQQEMEKNLIFSESKFGEQVHAALNEDEGKLFFGKMPPDLSLIARVRGSDWIFNYLKAFYLDESRPVGWNNKVFPNASMPNPLWQLPSCLGSVTACCTPCISQSTFGMLAPGNTVLFQPVGRDSST